MQQVVNAAPTAGERARTARMISALVTAGIDAGYLTNPRLVEVHWQAGGRPLPAPRVSVAGETALWVDPADADVTALARALAYLHPDYELMANTAAYTGLRRGELAALTTSQIDTAARVITVSRKMIAGACTSSRRRTASTARPSTPARAGGPVVVAIVVPASDERWSRRGSCR
jgi:integrase